MSTRSRPPRRRGLIIAAVVVPVLLVFAAATLAMIPMAITAFSAFAMTGGPSARAVRTSELISLGIFVAAVWGVIVLTRRIENRAFGEETGRAYSRAAALAILVAVPLAIASGLVGYIDANYEALYGAYPQDRVEGIRKLTSPPRGVGCFAARRLATAPPAQEDGYPADRATALLVRCPDTEPLLLQLSNSTFVKIRSEAGQALTHFLSDDPAWQRVLDLWLNDPVLRVREEVGDTLIKDMRDLSAERQQVVRDAIDRVTSQRERSHYLTTITIAGLQNNYDALWAVIDNPSMTVGARRYAIIETFYLKDPRSIPRLWKIARADYPAGFVPEQDEQDFRGLAQEELFKLAPGDQQYQPIVFNERTALVQLKKVMLAQAKYRGLFGHYATEIDCLETPNRCEAAGDSATLLRKFGTPADVMRGYSRTFTSTGEHYSMTVAPEQPGITGTFAFCADDSQRVCFSRDGIAPRVVAGLCPQSAAPPFVANAAGYDAVPDARQCLSR